MKRTKLLVLCLLGLCLTAGGAAFLVWNQRTDPAARGAVAEVNEFCPVMRGKAASPDYEVEFRGKKVRFCCQRCLEFFESNPPEYLPHLPQFSSADLTPRRTDNPSQGWDGWFLQGVDRVLQVGDKLQWTEGKEIFLVAFLAACLIALFALRRRKRLREDTPAPSVEASAPSRLRRLLRFQFRPSTLLIVLLAGLSAELGRRYLLLEEDNTRYSADLLAADREAKSWLELVEGLLAQVQSGADPRIKRSFYRGNDERDSRLVNGGNYRTCTFHLSLHGEDGHEIKQGEDLGGLGLSLRLEIERAPFTADGFFDPNTMKQVALTRAKNLKTIRKEAQEAQGLTVLEKDQRWEVFYPLGQVTGGGIPQARGFLFLCLADRKGGVVVPSQYHYWIYYDLYFKDGCLNPESTLWMGPIYLVPNLRGPSIKEWFSHEPIPVLPSKNTDDPKLLGLDAHKAP